MGLLSLFRVLTVSSDLRLASFGCRRSALIFGHLTATLACFALFECLRLIRRLLRLCSCLLLLGWTRTLFAGLLSHAASIPAAKTRRYAFFAWVLFHAMWATHCFLTSYPFSFAPATVLLQHLFYHLPPFVHTTSAFPSHFDALGHQWLRYADPFGRENEQKLLFLHTDATRTCCPFPCTVCLVLCCIHASMASLFSLILAGEKEQTASRTYTCVPKATSTFLLQNVPS